MMTEGSFKSSTHKIQIKTILYYDRLWNAKSVSKGLTNT